MDECRRWKADSAITCQIELQVRDVQDLLRKTLRDCITQKWLSLALLKGLGALLGMFLRDGQRGIRRTFRAFAGQGRSVFEGDLLQ